MVPRVLSRYSHPLHKFSSFLEFSTRVLTEIRSVKILWKGLIGAAAWHSAQIKTDGFVPGITAPKGPLPNLNFLTR